MMPVGIHTRCYLPKSVGKVVRWWWGGSSGLTNKSSFLMRTAWEFSSEIYFTGKYRNQYVLTRWHAWSKLKARDPPQNSLSGNTAT